MKYTLPEEMTRNRTKAPTQNFNKIRISDFFVFGQEKICDFDNSMNSFVGCCSLGTGQIDLDEWDNLAIDHRNLLFWHEVGKIQNDTIPRDGWEMAALAIGLGGAIGELWVQDGLLLLLALGLSSFAGYRLYLKNNSEKKLQDAIYADERAIDLACRFGYSVPNAYKSLGGALKELIEKTRKQKKRSFFEDRLDALRKSAEKARSELSQQEGSEKSVSSENVYGQ